MTCRPAAIHAEPPTPYFDLPANHRQALLALSQTGLGAAFDAFTFSLTGASVYHLGNFGTARTQLKTWELKQ